ncbi:ATP-binding cassette sub- A member 2 [Actinomortierella ambigua]|nr:ATP-binding cassette sub- A member 2 [Actinomortierella ambigua]
MQEFLPTSSSGKKGSNYLSTSGTNRRTAQATYNVVSQPSGGQQLKALVIKNVRIRSRDLAQTINAVFQPVFMMLILVFLHLSAKKPGYHMDVKALPFLSQDTCKSTTDCVYFGVTGIPQADPLITELQGFFDASEPQKVTPQFFPDEDSMVARHAASPVNFVIGIVFYGPSTNLTQAGAAGAVQDFKYDIKANHTAYGKHEYINSRFATAQAYVERAAINLHRKATGQASFSSPLPAKADPGIATSGIGRTFISYASFVGLGSSMNNAINPFYIIVCFQASWLGAMSVFVVEKHAKIRMGMTMMGMRQNVYLLSIWLMQNLQNLLTCALMLFVIFIGNIFTSSNPFIVFLLLFLFATYATAVGTIASVMVQDPKKTNTASFALLIFNVGAYGICMALVFSSGPMVDPTRETLLFLLPSVALGRAISYITNVESSQGAVTFANINEGPVGKALWMLVIDCMIFYFLAWYLDAVFPGENGSALPYDFFLRKSYWGIGEFNPANKAQKLPHLRIQDYTQSRDKQDMFEHFNINAIPADDRGIIQVSHLQKSFTSQPGFAYKIPLFGDIARLVYPPDPKRKLGPFAGPQTQHVVDQLSLELHRNEIFGFLGHNGAGKTTSLSIILGMLRPDSGRVLVNGHVMPGSEGQTRSEMDLRTLSEVQKTMGVCPQHDVLFDTLTAWETIQLYAAIKGVQVIGRKVPREDGLSEAEWTAQQLLDQYLEHLLDDMYLLEKKNERVVTYSGGMKRKLSVALAFLGDPKVVLLDEPTTGMDVYTRKQVWQLMQDSKQGRTILLTTHSMEEADALGDRIAILSKGRLQTLGSSLFLKNRFGLGYRLNLEKRRAMLTDQRQGNGHSSSGGRNGIQQQTADSDEVVLFDESTVTKIVHQYFPDATVETNTSTDITYLLPTTGPASSSPLRPNGAPLDKKAMLPQLFAHLDDEIAANRLGIRSVGLELTTLEEVFVRLQEEEAKESEGDSH